MKLLLLLILAGLLVAAGCTQQGTPKEVQEKTKQVPSEAMAVSETLGVAENTITEEDLTEIENITNGLVSEINELG